MSYGNTHRFFLRSMANRGALSMPESVKLLEKFTGQHKKEEDVLNLVKEINVEISSLKQRIQIVNDKNTEICEKSLIFINLITDMDTKTQTILKVKGCQYFKKVIGEIIRSDSRVLEYDEVVKDVTKAFGFKRNQRKEVEVLINKWCKLSYLKKITHTVEETRQENTNVGITLGLRGIYEFETYINDIRNHSKTPVKNCSHCKEKVIMGCQCNKCNKALHKPCLDKHMEKRHTNITSSDDDSSTEDQSDNSSITNEDELLDSGSDYEPGLGKRMKI